MTQVVDEVGAEDERVRMNHDFTGKVALVTGVASGMGLATAKAFARAGAAVRLADMDGAAARAAAEKLIVDPVLWLHGPSSSFVIGHALVVDGEYTAQ